MTLGNWEDNGVGASGDLLGKNKGVVSLVIPGQEKRILGTWGAWLGRKEDRQSMHS